MIHKLKKILEQKAQEAQQKAKDKKEADRARRAEWEIVWSVDV